MIVRALVAVRLGGRKRAVVPTRLVDGLARLVVTGRFHDWTETEIVDEADARRRVFRELEADGWTVADGAAVREDGGLSGGQERLVSTVRVHFHATHGRGRPGAEIELVAVPLARGGDGVDPAQLAARARAMLEAQGRAESRLAQARQRVEELVEQLDAAVRRALPVEALEASLEHGLARGWSTEALAGLPVAVAAWMSALESVGASGGWLAEVHPVGAEGGGLFDAVGADASAAAGGGEFGSAAHGAPAHGADASGAVGGGDFGGHGAGGHGA